MIKTSDNYGLDIVVDSVIYKVLISDTTLNSFIPPQVRKMNPMLHQICGCKIYIIPKDVHIYLNTFGIRLVIYLQQNYVGKHTHNSVFITTSSEH